MPKKMVQLGTNISDLEDKIHQKLEIILNIDGKWRDLIVAMEGSPIYFFRDYEIEEFGSKNHSLHSNAAQALLGRLGQLGMSVRELIQVLEKMHLEDALLLLKPFERIQVTELPQNPVKILTGDTLELSCQATSFPYPRYQWYKGQKKIEEGHERILRIANVSDEHTGGYSCRISHICMKTADEVRWVHSDVTILPASVKPGRTNQDIPRFCQGAQVSDTSPQVVHPQPNSFPSPPPPYPVEESISMYAPPPASYAPPPARYTPPPARYAPIIVTPPEEEVVVVRGKPFKLGCRADGSPTMTYQWLKNGILMQGEDYSYLQIDCAELEDNGRYQCIVRNPVGEVRTPEMYGKVMVQLPPGQVAPRILKQPASITMQEGESAEFNVGAIGLHLQYVWFFNGDRYKSATGSSLRLGAIGREHEGKYSCRVFNDHGECITKEVELTVVPAENFYATDKVALLIGQMSYMNEESLPAAKNDVINLSCQLKKMGFKVISLVDCNLVQMQNAIWAFKHLLAMGVYGLFLFVGHGFENNHQCYLVPYDAKAGFAIEDSLCANQVLQEMQEQKPAVCHLILDVCRQKNTQQTTQHHSDFKTSGNTCIYFATSPDLKAFEYGDEDSLTHQRQGVFMKHFLKVIDRQKSLLHLFGDILDEFQIDKLTADKQKPEIRYNIMGNRGLHDPIIYKGHTRAMDQRWQDFNLSHALPRPPPTVIDGGYTFMYHFESTLSNEMIMKITFRPPHPSIPCCIEQFQIMDVPPSIIADASVNRSNGEAAVTFKALQNLQGPLQPLLQFNVIIREQRFKVPQFRVNLGNPLVSVLNLCQPHPCLPQSVLHMQHREATEHDETSLCKFS